jgi:hypothetical protein
MYVKLLSGKRNLVPNAEGSCSPCGAEPQLMAESECIRPGYVDGYC